MQIVNYTLPVRDADVKAIKAMLKMHGFSFSDRQYAYFSSKREKLHVTIYERGPKALVQGNGAKDFVKATLKPFLAEITK